MKHNRSWMPCSRSCMHDWRKSVIEKAHGDEERFHPVIKQFQKMIEDDQELFMLFNLMFAEVPKKFKDDPDGHHQIRDYKTMLKTVNHIMTEAPVYNSNGMVGCPINAILDYSMATTAGFSAFLNKKLNRHLKDVLNEWGVFLASPDSRHVLNDDPEHGWFGKEAGFHMFGNYETKFSDVYQCDPSLPYYGFKSWDDFFTREFVEGQRPLAGPGDDSIIVCACESAPYRVAENVELVQKFWIKGQPYSLKHMLENDPLVPQFVGGTIYQAFLSALSYHRWHSPVSGTIVKTYLIEGTYFSEALSAGYDEEAPNGSQAYLAQMATRAVIFIQADNPDIGLMCFMGIGMSEVSTCQTTVYEGQHVTKGDQLGMFHFGGSSHCLLFRPEVKLEFDLHGLTPSVTNSENIPLRSRIATVLPCGPATKKAKK